ncbi:twin-arginine translocase subunit TatC [Phaeovibrio sulfidiphilus]|uniref:Sec-independent protein translocase protein TatC n=2 Tax=Phaeovibrio sulfidiphilus TaxID=1220600 RepID=A0A8J6YUU8_9PROT|nr:twin-arginine translocase subunit TatC [Phaeovibrio sulfidiphilus]
MELRTRLLWSALFFIVAFFVCFWAAQYIYNFLLIPLAQTMERVGGSQRMIFTAITEMFFTYVKVGAFGAVIVSFPIFATQLWKFVAPGLYRHEKRALLPFLLLSPILFAAGGAMVYYVVMPMAWEFLLGFQTTRAETVLPIQLEAKVGEYLSLVMRLMLAFGFCFQMPVILTLLARTGAVSADGLARGRKYAIVFIFIVAAVLTPPDVISQLLLALPMIVLYEASVWAAKLAERARRKSLEREEAAGLPQPVGGASATGAGSTPAPAGASASAGPVSGALPAPAPASPSAPAPAQAPAPVAPRAAALSASAGSSWLARADGMIDETDFNHSP